MIGYAIVWHLYLHLTMAAIRAADGARNPAPGCIHHCDRGSRYDPAVYRALLTQHQLVGSMRRRGSPPDNS